MINQLENGDLADLLNLNEGIEFTFFQFRCNEGLTKVMSVFVEAYYSSIHVNKAADDIRFGKYAKLSVIQLVSLSIVICQIVVPPPSVREFISAVQIHAPYVGLSREVLIHQEVVSADSKADSWVFVFQLIESELEIVFVVLVS
jgi:hypothetical protein